jgi:hypothetical protein
MGGAWPPRAPHSTPLPSLAAAAAPCAPSTQAPLMLVSSGTITHTTLIQSHHPQSLPPHLHPHPHPTPRYLTALIFAITAVGLTAIESDLAANFVVIGLVTGLNFGAYLGWLWLVAH